MGRLVFDLPEELLVTLYLKDVHPSHHIPDVDVHHSRNSLEQEKETKSSETKAFTSCQLCQASFHNVQEQRRHVKSDWHHYNLKQKLRRIGPVTENDFEKLIDELDESISGSGSETSDSEVDCEGTGASTLTSLLKHQARLSHANREGEEFMPKKRKRGAGRPPLIWFSTPLLNSNTSLGVYRGLFTNKEQEESDLVNVLHRKQLRPVLPKPSVTDGSDGVPLPSEMTSPSIFMCMIGGGHFAGMIVSLAPKLGKQSAGIEQRQAAVLAHKTFHRYTTRRKQGGSQSANDSAKGAAHSAGSSLRRYNEVALEQDIRALLSEWRNMIGSAQLIFVRATGSSNRRILFGPYDGQVLRQNDPRNRTFPFSTRRATQSELMRAFVELTRVKVSQVDEDSLVRAEADPETSLTGLQPKQHATSKPVISKEDEEAALHTSQLQALIRRSRIPALLSYLSSNSLSANYPFHPPSAHANYHASTPLHLASSTNTAPVVLALMTKAGADPTIANGEGKPAFDLAGDRVTRDAFRVARSELGEDSWHWNTAHVPPALSKTEAEQRDALEKAEIEKAESARRKADEERLRKEIPKVDAPVKKSGKALSTTPKTAEERREEDARGLTPEMAMKVERERRARAAEERMKKMAGR